ncbi:hypothetical protein DsansV1_C04g0037561 [Dioscorea sansibarensis]
MCIKYPSSNACKQHGELQSITFESRKFFRSSLPILDKEPCSRICLFNKFFLSFHRSSECFMEIRSYGE